MGLWASTRKQVISHCGVFSNKNSHWSGCPSVHQASDIAIVAVTLPLFDDAVAASP